MERLNKQLTNLLSSGLGHEWIANYMNVSLEVVQDAELGIFQPEPIKLSKPAPKIFTTAKLVPASRPFPDIESMSDTERIIALTNHGISVKKIQRHLSFPIGEKAINRYVVAKLGLAPTGTAGGENQIGISFMPYVIECLDRLGKDRFTCELCLEPVPKGCIVHHTKYEGATVYDLMYVCASCNLARANVGLV